MNDSETLSISFFSQLQLFKSDLFGLVLTLKSQSKTFKRTLYNEDPLFNI